MKRYLRLCFVVVACATFMVIPTLLSSQISHPPSIPHHSLHSSRSSSKHTFTNHEREPHQLELEIEEQRQEREQQNHDLLAKEEEDRQAKPTAPSVCIYSPWSTWSSCNDACGDPSAVDSNQHTVRSRKLLAGTEADCNPLQEEKPCDCDSWVECTLTPWSAWQQCSSECGFATKRRFRTPLSSMLAPQCARTFLQLEDVQSCELAPCNPKAGPVFVKQDDTIVKLDDTSSSSNTSSTHLGCDDYKSINYSDGSPFARGYTKEVWRAEIGDKDVVVKRPIGVKHNSRFVKGIVWEEKWLQKLGASPYLMEYYGSCIQKDHAFEAVEGGLVKWDQVMWSDAPWCFRIQMAMEATRIVEFMHNKSVTHCDWKYDQVAIDRTGHVKLVDVKSVRWLLPDKAPYKSNTPCTAASAATVCFKCMKILNLTSDHLCLNGKCSGYDVRSLVAATAQSFYHPLLVNWLKDPPTATDGGDANAFRADVANLVLNCNRTLPSERWTLPQIHAFFDDLMGKYNGQQCLEQSKEMIQATLNNSYKKMLDDRHSRCQNRYC